MSTLIDGSSNVSIDTSTGAPRITGDFSNATVANRVMFQTSTVNGVTTVGLIPNGTATGASFFAHNAANPNNCSIMGMYIDSVSGYLYSGAYGTGTYLPMTFYTGGAERLRISTDGVITAGAGNMMLVSMTAQASTSGTSIDFTGIPSWAKRITVMLNGVSVSGSSLLQLQLGAGSVTTSGYSSAGSTNGATSALYTSGLLANGRGNATSAVRGLLTIANISGNIWVMSGVTGAFDTTPNYDVWSMAGSISLGGTLDRLRLTTVNGTDTFDAGTINVMYE